MGIAQAAMRGNSGSPSVRIAPNLGDKERSLTQSQTRPSRKDIYCAGLIFCR